MKQESPVPARHNARPLILRIFLITSIAIAVTTITVGAAARLRSLVQDADVGVIKNAPDSAQADTNITYTITVFNTGPNSTSATLDDALPSGTTFVSLDSPAGWLCSTPSAGGTGSVTCNNQGFGVSSGDIFTLIVHIDSGVPAGTFINNQATVTTQDFDANEENNTSSVSTTVMGESADVSLAKTASNDKFPADQNVTYTITVINAGPNAAADASWSDTLPGTLTFVSLASPPNWSCNTPGVGSGGNVNCTRTSLAAGDGAQVFTLVAHIPANTPDGTEFLNQASVTANTFDPNSENNASTVGITVGCVLNPFVTSTADSGAGTLREAITNACVGSTISFASDLTSGGPATITLTSGELLIDKNLTIIGPGANLLTIHGNNSNRVFEILQNKTVNLSGLKITNGNLASNGTNKGAGILNAGNLTINNCAIVNNTSAGGSSSINTGGGIFNDAGSLNITNSTVSDNSAVGGCSTQGGGIANAGTLTITTSTISNNSVKNAAGCGGVNSGAGIFNQGTLTLTSSTVSGNAASSSSSFNDAGGIFNSGTATLTSSTLSGNSVSGSTGSFNGGGGIYSIFSKVVIINSTLSGNSVNGGTNQGGGVFSGGAGSNLVIVSSTLSANSATNGNTNTGGGIITNSVPGSLRNTIVSGNSASVGPDVSGDYTSQGNNLIGASNGGTGFANGVNSDKVGSVASPVNALLAPLGNNGGPTQTHELLPGSPAIDAGNNCITNVAHCGDINIPQLTTDQRGFARQVNTVDIGALETNYSISATAGTPQSTNVNSAFATALKVTVTDSGSPINNVPVTFTAPGSGASGSFPGPSTTVVVATNSNGVATAPTFTANAIGGSYNVVASLAPGFPTASFALTNNKLNQTITFSAISNKTTLDADFVVSPTASSGLLVALSASGQCTVTTPSPGTVHITGAGSCTITASQAGNATYNAASDVARSFTISKANQTITFASIGSKTFGDADFVVSPTASSGLPVSLAASGNCSVTTPAPGTVHITGAGSCTITASQSGNATYNAASDVGQTFTIAKAATSTALSSSINPSNTGQNVTFTATVSSTAGTPTGTVQFKDGGTNLGSPQALNGSGVATFSTALLGPGVHAITADYSGDSNFQTSTGTLAGGQQVGSIIRFSSSSYNTTENSGSTTITVERIGDLSQAVTVDYTTPDDSSAMTILPCSTANGVASARCDFEAAFGAIQFAAGDGAAKTFKVLINQDNFVEGTETLTLTLSNITGGAGFATPGATSATATLSITDDVTEPAGNPIDDTDTFVRQQYRDFLSRDPDAQGLAFWKDEIDKCNDPARRPPGLTVAQCIEVQRINTSAAFFLSIEFQNTGYFVERVYKAAFGDINPPTVPVPVRFNNFFADTRQISNRVIVGQGNWDAQLESNKVAYTQSFVQRTAFLNRYPGLTSATAFVDSLNTNAGNVLSDSQRSALIAELSPSPADPILRASVLRKVADNPTLQQNESNRAFVLLQYFGYLRRNPDAAPELGLDFAGYNFWLNKLNQANGNFVQAEMVKAFLSSIEYRSRFGQ